MPRSTELDRETAVAVAQEQLRLILSDTSVTDVRRVDQYRSYLVNDRHGYLSSRRLLELQRALEESENTPPSARVHDEIMGYAEAMLRENMQLPEWLATYSADVLGGHRTRPRGKGMPRIDKRREDFAIYLAVTQLKDRYGLRVFSNNEADPEVSFTACEMVAQAARREGLKRSVSADAIRAVWRKFERVPKPSV